jgi:hypothetical protein
MRARESRLHPIMPEFTLSVEHAFRPVFMLFRRCGQFGMETRRLWISVHKSMAVEPGDTVDRFRFARHNE